VLLALAGIAFAAAPMTETVYVLGSLLYSFFVGVAYATWTASVLHSIGSTSAATKFSIYASLANFPIWWVGLLNGVLADHFGATNMLYTEAALGIGAAVLFAGLTALIARTRLPDELPAAG